MSRANTVPVELFDHLSEQLTQALQMVAALALTDEEVSQCNRDAPGSGWAKNMREELLGPGREKLLELLKKHGFLTNTSSGYIFGAFQGPQINGQVASHAETLASLCTEHVRTNHMEIPEEPILEKEIRKTLISSQGARPEVADYLIELSASRIAWAELKALVKTSERKKLEKELKTYMGEE